MYRLLSKRHSLTRTRRQQALVAQRRHFDRLHEFNARVIECSGQVEICRKPQYDRG
jgi:hypothetical protein